MGNENWLRVPLYKIINILNGYAFKSQKYVSDGIRVIRIANVQDGYIEDEKPVFYPEDTRDEIEGYLLRDGDLLMSLTGNVGRVAILDESMLPAALNQRVACLRIKKENILDIRYLFYYFQQHIFQKHCIDNAKGTAQLNMSTEWLKKYEILLPTLAEQQHIVEQIESMFDKLDEVSEIVQYVIEQYKEERAAIIHKAYTGELTKCWREKNSIDDAWEQIKVEDLCKSLKYGTAKKSKEEGSVIVIRMGNLQSGEIVWDNLAYTDDVDDIGKYKLETGDVLFNRTNSPEWVGKTSIYRGEYPAIYAGYLIKLDYHRDKVLGEFLNYMLNSPIAKEYCNKVKTDGVNQSNINAKKIGAFEIPVPSLEEQKEIVRILDALLKKRKDVLDLTETVQEQISMLKKSILAKAFCGELGTNNPDEESAIELLKSILA